MVARGTRKIGRDSGTGRIIPLAEARRRKKTATVEKIPIIKKKRKAL